MWMSDPQSRFEMRRSSDDEENLAWGDDEEKDEDDDEKEKEEDDEWEVEEPDAESPEEEDVAWEIDREDDKDDWNSVVGPFFVEASSTIRFSESPVCLERAAFLGRAEFEGTPRRRVMRRVRAAPRA